MIIVPVEKKVDWKRPPIILILLVLLNVVFFVFYQSGDSDLLEDAVEVYYDKGLLNKEWSAYKAYSRRNNSHYGEDTGLKRDDPETIWYIVSDRGFDRFIAKNYRHYIPEKDQRRWRIDRDHVESISSRISGTALGLNSADVQPLQLISYQFLHGGAMHIIGNMVFLILTGFAVEAALGSLRFLCFYLLSGIGSGLLFALVDSSAGSLVGASGSISGVMAMYVVLFGMRKIEFFYWFFIFTGYVRAAAIIMLPFYVGFELYKFFSDDGSNVAYTAHIGGFITGAALVFLTQSLNKTAIDEGYIEKSLDQADPFSQSLTKLYALIAQCDFKRAWAALKPLKANNPDKPILIEIEFNLVRALHTSKLDEYLRHRMDKTGNHKALVGAQLKAWNRYGDEQKNAISIVKLSKLLENALTFDEVAAAEALFANAELRGLDRMELAVFARQISVYCQANQLHDKRYHYSELAKNLAKADIHRAEKSGAITNAVTTNADDSSASKSKSRGVF